MRGGTVIKLGVHIAARHLESQSEHIREHFYTSIHCKNLCGS